ncbi:MAG: hypothetical protein K0M56_11540 [Kaistella sp.]|nr:hypothetical protein [Kaistella sp.]
MKKLYTAVLVAGFSAFGWAQEEIVNPFKKTEEQYYAFEVARNPGAGGDLGGDDAPAAPIDSPVPYLVVTGLILAAWYGRRKVGMTK